MNNTAVVDSQCCELINQYLFDNVWNEPVSEYRTNIHPQLISKDSKVGTFRVLDATIFLPTRNKSYYVYFIKAGDLNITFPELGSEWMDSAVIGNRFRTLIHTYTSTGMMIPKGAVYFRYNKRRDVLFLAIEKKAFKRLVPLQKLESVYLTFYYDSDVEKTFKIFSKYIELTSDIEKAMREMDELLTFRDHDDCVLQFQDGLEITDLTKSLVPEVGHYYDVIVDNNIKYAFDVDFKDALTVGSFHSDLDKCHKYLIHIPRVLNPNNDVITHNTCDFFMRQRLHNVGKYIHRSGHGRTITQVTHNDMAIPEFIVDAYRDYLQDQDVTLRCLVRIHEKNNRLIRDRNYIDLLYHHSHSDNDIVKFLSGSHLTKMPWWEAKHLEQSKYVEMMFDSTNGTQRDNIDKCIDALGFYNTVNLLCRRIVDYDTDSKFEKTITFGLPLLYSGKPVVPVVYLNHKKLHFASYQYSCNLLKNTCTVFFNDNVYIPTGTNISIEFFLSGENTIYTFVVGQDGDYTFNLPYKQFAVYLQEENDKPCKGAMYSSKYSYRYIEPVSNIYITTENEGGQTITFNSEYVGRKFIVQNIECTYVKSYNIDEFAHAGKTLAVSLTNESQLGVPYPILDIVNTSVYLNGKYLVKDIDYTISTIRDENKNIAAHELIIQTMDHFSEKHENILDFIINVANVEEISTGFCIDNKLTDKTPVNLFFPNITSVHVNNELSRHGTYHGTFIDVSDPGYENGSIFEIQTSIPKIVSDFVHSYQKDDDIEKLKKLNEYFYKEGILDPDKIILEKKHRIYSVMLNNFIQDVVNGKVPVINDPDPSRAKDAIKPYLYLKDMDIVFKGTDQRFVDFYPQYVNYSVDADMKKFIDRYIQEYMPKNSIPTLEVVYE